jgi:Protein of unknown function (DUF1569)
MSVDTAKVEGRRELAYGSLDELLADADQLCSAPMKTLGNWSAGQIFKHLANAYNGSLDGISMTFPWPMRMMAKLFKNKLINGQMPPGIKLPGEGAKKMMPGPTSTEEGLAALHAAVARLKQESHRVPHPVFGKLTNDEWNRIHLMHANLHMSFLAPGD